MKLTKAFFEDIRRLIRSARATVARGVDLVQVRTNFEIGRRIVEQEQKGKDRAAYGEQVIKALAERLTKEFGRGFSKRNLEVIRRFYLLYADRQRPIAQSMIAQLRNGPKTQSVIAQSVSEPIFQPSTGKSQIGSGQFEISQTVSAKSISPIHQPLTGELPPRPFTLSWTHYVFLLGVKNPEERSFYEIEAANQNWTVRELKRQFDSSLYERLALSRDKKGIRKLAQEGQIVTQPSDLLKEPFVLEFLGLEESHRYNESDLEDAIITRLEHFLLEIGKGFLFEARQRRFTLDGSTTSWTSCSTTACCAVMCCWT